MNTKNFILRLGLGMISTNAFSQIGVNTSNPHGAFHVDGAKDNSAAGNPSAAQQANDFVVTPEGNVGFGTISPSNRLDVNGIVRIRTVDQAPSSTSVSPVYIDPNGVIVKSPPPNNYGEITYRSASVASGAAATLITGLENGAFRVTVITGGQCGNMVTVEFFLHNYSLNNYFGLNGQNGFAISAISPGRPAFTQTIKTSVAVTWLGLAICADGGNSTANDFTLSMPSFGTINVTNNGNVSRTYRIVLTRLD
ncbi:hypothetical protein [Chryseobacterium sp.]|uniref:hypothetical protein n=1 Tax=Chryseobacterium sp. TaxID=1871047 RepID=UPI0031CE13A5